MKKIAALTLILTAIIINTSIAETVNIIDLGADPTAKTISTDAINAAIQTCVSKGGGTVIVPAGSYLTGTIFLKSNITFQLQPGAIIYGSRKLEDYPDIETCYWQKDAHFLFFAKDAENITIQGSGIIDGNGDAYWNTPLKPKRPKTIQFRECKNITFRDFTIRNSACYNIHTIACDNLKITGITITNPYSSPNTDGLDIDCCSNVMISDCKIETGDDCIAIKSDRTRACSEKACEKITITNCTLKTSCCGMRIGWEGDNAIQDCTFSNLVIYDTSTGIDFISVLPTSDPAKSFGSLITEGAKIQRLTFSNITMDNVFHPVEMVIRKDKDMKDTPQKGLIKDIVMTNMVIRTDSFSTFSGLDENKIENLTLSNIQYILLASEILEKQICPEKLKTARTRYETGDKVIQPLNFYNVKNLNLSNISFRYEAQNDFWGSALRINNSENVTIQTLTGGPYSENFPVIAMSGVNKAFVTNCFITAPAKKLIESDEKTKELTTTNNFIKETIQINSK